MRITLPLLFATITAGFIYTGSIAQTKATSDLTTGKLYGKVKTLTTTEYRADSSGGKINKGRMGSRVTIQYDENGNRISELTYKTDSTLKQKLTQSNDTQGRHTEGITYDSTGNTILEKISYTYDDKNNLTAMTRLMPDGKADGKLARVYDKNGKVTEEKYFHPINNYLGRKVFRYDSTGNCVEQNMYAKGDMLVSNYNFTCNNKGWIITDVGYPQPGARVEKLSFRYENMDANGNWLYEVEFKNGAADKITERVIAYY